MYVIGGYEEGLVVGLNWPSWYALDAPEEEGGMIMGFEDYEKARAWVYGCADAPDEEVDEWLDTGSILIIGEDDAFYPDERDIKPRNSI